MTLRLVRRWFSPVATVGELFLDEARECYTLEDVVRDPDGAGPATGPKIAGATAIPYGSYRVILSPSERARRGGLWTPSPDYLLPLLLDVPGFEGVRIHAGNTAAHTEGCILVGRTRLPDALGDSRPALAALLAKLLGRGPDALTLTIEPGAA